MGRSGALAPGTDTNPAAPS